MAALTLPRGLIPLALPRGAPCASEGGPATFDLEQRVDCLYKASVLGGAFGCKWCPGVVAGAGADGLYSIRYDNGELETGVQPEYIRPSAEPLVPPAVQPEAAWIVRLREQALRSSEKRLRTYRSFASAIRPAEVSLSKLGINVRLVDAEGLPITPDAFVFLGVILAVQVQVLSLLSAPFRAT